MSISSYKTLDYKIARAREREIELDLQTQRKMEQVHTSVGKTKRHNTFDSYFRGQRGRALLASVAGYIMEHVQQQVLVVLGVVRLDILVGIPLMEH